MRSRDDSTPSSETSYSAHSSSMREHNSQIVDVWILFGRSLLVDCFLPGCILNDHPFHIWLDGGGDGGVVPPSQVVGCQNGLIGRLLLAGVGLCF